MYDRRACNAEGKKGIDRRMPRWFATRLGYRTRRQRESEQGGRKRFGVARRRRQVQGRSDSRMHLTPQDRGDLGGQRIGGAIDSRTVALNLVTMSVVRTSVVMTSVVR